MNAIKAMYTSVKYCIKINDRLTRPIESSKGLQQGDLLSPMLFNLFINDLQDIFDDRIYIPHLTILHTVIFKKLANCGKAARTVNHIFMR